MKEIYLGHTYELDHLDGDGKSTLQFVQRKPHHEPKEGVTNQEVIRAIIARVKVLDAEVPWGGGQQTNPASSTDGYCASRGARLDPPR